MTAVLEVDLRPLIEKYYFGLYIPNNKHKSLPDTQNESERYPESKGYSIPKIWYRSISRDTFVVDIKLVESIEEDIRKIRDILRLKVYSLVVS